ncbi:MAG: 6-carboxytetrahydropterin synthase QueD [Candidatus Adiutrix sp.]|jgi:6-pyruvoyltetrahydropterin/6-carboxytetrahydropterin synthase|nr:6-carboxytetrahydropterin synthase QueD [Candidatus Adiutrix sp.]
MFELKVTDHFSAAHNLREFYGKCENLHGHNWFVEARVRARNLDKTGLVMDFGLIKKCLKTVLDIIDHQYLNEIEAFKIDNPSSENIAIFIFNNLAPYISEETDGRAWLHSVSAWESGNASATCMAD